MTGHFSKYEIIFYFQSIDANELSLGRALTASQRYGRFNQTCDAAKCLKCLVAGAGLEPATSGL
jgi:hypothetical protein